MPFAKSVAVTSKSCYEPNFKNDAEKHSIVTVLPLQHPILEENAPCLPLEVEDLFAEIERASIQAETVPVQHIHKRASLPLQATAVPRFGDYCGYCAGHLWWSTASEAWFCGWCHPVDDLKAGAFSVVAT